MGTDRRRDVEGQVLKALEEGPEDSGKAGVILGKIVCTDGISHQEYPRLRPRGRETETHLRISVVHGGQEEEQGDGLYNQRLSPGPVRAWLDSCGCLECALGCEDASGVF